MRLRTRVIVGASFALGYYFGAKAGRERYEQIRKGLDALPIGAAASKARALADLGVERVRRAISREPASPLHAVATPEDAARAAQLSSR
jgi:hypothetical protein